MYSPCHDQDVRYEQHRGHRPLVHAAARLEASVPDQCTGHVVPVPSRDSPTLSPGVRLVYYDERRVLGSQIGLQNRLCGVQILDGVRVLPSTDAHLFLCKLNRVPSKWTPACSGAFHGVWRSLVARVLWEHDVAGSNPVTPTRRRPYGIREDRPSLGHSTGAPVSR